MRCSGSDSQGVLGVLLWSRSLRWRAPASAHGRVDVYDAPGLGMPPSGAKPVLLRSEPPMCAQPRATAAPALAMWSPLSLMCRNPPGRTAGPIRSEVRARRLEPAFGEQAVAALRAWEGRDSGVSRSGLLQLCTRRSYGGQQGKLLLLLFGPELPPPSPRRAPFPPSCSHAYMGQRD